MATTQPQTIPAELEAFVEARKRPAVFLFVPDSLELFHVLAIQGALQDKNADELDLVIFSGGGSIDAAYQTVELLRLHCKKLFACVPFYAKSAATLLCIGADEIVLDEMAQLGPLDAQVFEGKRNGKGQYKSALNPFKALEQVQKFSLETLHTALRLMDRETELTSSECLGHAVEFVRVTAEPLFRQLSPEKLGEYSRALAVGKEYGERLLRRFSKWDKNKRADVLERLVHGYPSHEYIIDYHELQELGFRATLFAKEEREAVAGLLPMMMTTKRALIQFVEPKVQPTTTDTTTTGGAAPTSSTVNVETTRT